MEVVNILKFKNMNLVWLLLKSGQMLYITDTQIKKLVKKRLSKMSLKKETDGLILVT